MREKEKTAETGRKAFHTGSKMSYETDPALKDLAKDLQKNSSDLRTDEVSANPYPTENEILLFAKAAGSLPELKLDYKDSIRKISAVFSKAFDDLSQLDEVNLEIQRMLVENFFQTARALAISVEARDPYTGGHSERVFQISTAVGRRCNLSPIEQMYLEGGALLHDVGKIGVRDGVLLKAGPLTDSEYKEMQLHPIIGAQMVKKLNCLFGCVDPVLFHHERMDGYGYPYGLKGKEIPFTARIASIEDAYDAMTTNRVYRKALSHEDAIEEIIRNSGTQFDPEIVKVFIGWWEENYKKFPKVSDKNSLV